jgi:hypothetical protein
MFQDMFIGAYCNLSEIWAAVGLPPQTPWLRGGRGVSSMRHPSLLLLVATRRVCAMTVSTRNSS